MVMVQLDSRQEEFLARVIEAHIRTADPVGSRALARATGVTLSPASIRATLASLEALGYVARPHPSAGRVPTDAGYRYYVDRLKPRSPIVAEARERLRRLLERRYTLSMDSVGPIVDEVAGEVHQLTLAAGIDPDRAWVYYSGTRHMLEQPEFARASTAAPIFGLLDERTTIGRALATLTEGDRVGVRIGCENALEVMRSCALVGVRVRRAPARAFAILGPTRLDYPGVMSCLMMLRDLVNELGEEA